MIAAAVLLVVHVIVITTALWLERKEAQKAAGEPGVDGGRGHKKTPVRERGQGFKPAP
jgi:hypothetical protein